MLVFRVARLSVLRTLCAWLCLCTRVLVNACSLCSIACVRCTCVYIRVYSHTCTTYNVVRMRRYGCMCVYVNRRVSMRVFDLHKLYATYIQIHVYYIAMYVMHFLQCTLYIYVHCALCISTMYVMYTYNIRRYMHYQCAYQYMWLSIRQLCEITNNIPPCREYMYYNRLSVNKCMWVCTTFTKHALHSVHRTLYVVLRTLSHTVRRTVYTVHCTVYVM